MSNCTSPDLFLHPDFDDHENVCFVTDSASGLRAIIAIHRHGEMFAAGGIRMFPYADTQAALRDVLRLSRTMTYKLAVAGLPVGGAKSVIIGDPEVDKTAELLTAFAGAVDRMGGSYRCGCDVGINADDLSIIRDHTAYTPPARLGDLAVPTATGVYHAIRAGVEVALGKSSLEGVSVAVQGLGQVGARLCNTLAADGCRLVAADIDTSRSSAVAEESGATIISPHEILAADVDVLSPCALGGALSRNSLPDIRAKVICGAANNQLAAPDIDRALRIAGILYVPDFVANAGGVIGGLQVDCGYDENESADRVSAIYDSVHAILDLATESGTSTNVAAERFARQILDAN
jgi:leucine dehydrogenase